VDCESARTGCSDRPGHNTQTASQLQFQFQLVVSANSLTLRGACFTGYRGLERCDMGMGSLVAAVAAVAGRVRPFRARPAPARLPWAVTSSHGTHRCNRCDRANAAARTMPRTPCTRTMPMRAQDTFVDTVLLNAFSSLLASQAQVISDGGWDFGVRACMVCCGGADCAVLQVINTTNANCPLPR
jgi:hypothetical protein